MNDEVEMIGPRLEWLAAHHGDKEAILFVDGERWTWTQVLERARGHAAGLQSIGIRQDEFVLSWQPNGPSAVLTFLALAMLGAVYVPINTAYRGELLRYVIANSGARTMIAHGGLIDRLASVDCGALETLIVQGSERVDLPGVKVIGSETLEEPATTFQPPERAIAPWDTLMVIYTSGTTGPSKGVLSSYRHACRAAREFRNVGPGDRNLSAMPMFHVGGIYPILWAMLHVGSVVVAPGFRTGDFWRIVREYGVSTTGLLGSMVEFLNSQPPASDDRDHPLRHVLVAPYGPGGQAFAKRFGVDVYTEFNMTELSVPLFAGPNPQAVGTCGTQRTGVDLRLVDVNDIEVSDGEIGELILRTDRPWEISHGYLNAPEATAAAWRNGWFHTGDLFRRDEAGNYFFVDRRKDALRRRGENISSFEVEAAIRQHPAVSEVAVVGVPDDAAVEDEVMAIIQRRHGQSAAPEELIAFLEDHLPAFMTPRYIRFVGDFPRTPTQKIEKHRLRAEGVTADSWDRTKAGIALKRDRLESR